MSEAFYNEQRKQRSSEKLGITRSQYTYILRIGSILRQLYENDCNGFQTWDYKEDIHAQDRNNRRIVKYELIAQKFATNNKLHLHLQGDCRGATIYLSKHAIPENNYTIAVCVY
jgi:hypothetical protein